MTDKDTLLNFIDDYRCHSVLWDTSDKAYTNKNKRNEAYESLGKKYNMSVKGVKTKIKNLRSYFSKEQQKMLVKKSGAGSEDRYETSWFAYKSLLFIGDSLTPRFTKDSMQHEIATNAEDGDTIVEEELRERQDAIYSPQALEQEEATTLNEVTIVDEGTEKGGAQGRFATPFSNRRNVKRKIDDDKAKEDRAYAFLDQAAQEFLNKDDSAVFGQLVATQIRKLSPRNQAIARNRIQNMLFELEMEEMGSTSIPQFQQYVTVDVDEAVIVDGIPSQTSNNVCEIINMPPTETNTVTEFLTFDIAGGKPKK